MINVDNKTSVNLIILYTIEATKKIKFFVPVSRYLFRFFTVYLVFKLEYL